MVVREAAQMMVMAAGLCWSISQTIERWELWLVACPLSLSHLGQTFAPTTQPTARPTRPTTSPTEVPSNSPSAAPITVPSSQPTQVKGHRRMMMMMRRRRRTKEQEDNMEADVYSYGLSWLAMGDVIEMQSPSTSPTDVPTTLLTTIPSSQPTSVRT
jgi:hypothetical protein